MRDAHANILNLHQTGARPAFFMALVLSRPAAIAIKAVSSFPNPRFPMKHSPLLPSLAALALLGSASPGAELLGLYDFEGDFDDSSTAGNNPTAVNPNVGFVPGFGGGQAADFDPASTGIGINLPIDLNTAVNPDLTIGAWVNADAVANSSPFGGDDGGWDRGLSTAGFGTTWGVSNGNIYNSGLPVGGGWQFLAVTFRNNIMTVNVDGATFTHAGFPGPSAHTGISVGSLNPGATTHPFSGAIDNFFVYDSALTAKQLEAIRTNGISAITQTNDANVGARTVQNTWDFESGDLTGWTVLAAGVPGSNNVFSSGGQPANTTDGDSANINATAEGSFYVRTWDGQAGGLGLSDEPTGVIRSDEFVLGPNAEFEFLVGGGSHAWTGDPDDATLADNITAFNLEREVAPGDWEVIFTASGNGSPDDGNFFRDGFWDAGLFEGETVRLGIYDTHQGAWGHIDVDNIRYSTALTIPEPAVASLLGLIGVGLMFRRRR